MATDKKSFVLYCDSITIVEKLSDERAGKLIKHIFRYCSDLNPITDDEVVDMAFEHFKSILKRDLVKYNKIVDRNKANGSKGGRPTKVVTEVNPKNPLGYLETQSNPIEPKKADTVTETVNDTVTDISFKKETKKIFNDEINYPLPFSENFKEHWKKWIDYKKTQFRFTYKSQETINTALWDLVKKSSDKEENAILIINNSIANGYKGLFELKNEQNGTKQQFTTGAKKQVRSNLAGYLGNNGQAENGNSKGEFFEDTECTIIE